MTLNIQCPLHSSLARGVRSRLLRAVCFCLILCGISVQAIAAKVLIVGDLQYPFVAEIASEVHAKLRSQANELTMSEVRGHLASVVERENAQVVVALGSEATNEALRLPSDISVIYGLVTVPPKSSRGNLTGVYMSPPVSEYLAVIRRYFPGIGRVSALGSPAMIKALGVSGNPQVASYAVNSSVELIAALSRLPDVQALLLLPDANVLTASAMESVYAVSFRRNIPVFGVSEANVKQGALMALVFDSKSLSSQLGEKAQSILNGEDASELPATPAKRFHLYVNVNTARKMGLDVPDELLKRARKVYQ